MRIDQVEFRGSFPDVALCPKDDRPEYAFIGRSNVGKSSLINMLVGRKEIAHTSKKPGKTQLINYFLVNHQWYLVDLPGYGYAKISKTKRKAWVKMIDGYMQKRKSLQCAMVLIDINVSTQKIDIDFINNLGLMRLPFAIVYTKIDRLKPAEFEANLEVFRQEIYKHWNALPQEFFTSSRNGDGRDEILDFVAGINLKLENTHEEKK